MKPILVVDDEPIVRESIRDWLQDAGFEVVIADTGEEALALVRERDFALIIMDIRLPGKTGVAVLKDVKSLKPGIRSIIITAYPSEEIIAEARRLGVIDCLIKPIAPDSLERLVLETVDMLEPGE